MTDITRAAKRSHNLGRPLSSRDKFPRVAKGTRDAVLRGGVEERARMLETENGHLRRRLADLEAEKAAAGWPGDATGMLVATYKGEYHPTPPQLYAAKIVYDRELDRNRAELDAQRRALDERDRAGDATLEKLIAQFAEFTADRSAELDALVAAGDVTPSGAETIRSWFIRDAPVALPAPAETPGGAGY
jgi:hypothetical protein